MAADSSMPQTGLVLLSASLAARACKRGHCPFAARKGLRLRTSPPSSRAPVYQHLDRPYHGGVPQVTRCKATFGSGCLGQGLPGSVILNTMYEMNQTNYDMECPLISKCRVPASPRAAGHCCPIEEGETQRTRWSAWWPTYCGAVAHEFRNPSPEEGEEEGHDDRCLRCTGDSFTPTAGQYAQSRAMTRPQCQDVISEVFDHFVELSGDGRVGDDGCIRGGLALLGSKRVVVVASFKGHTPSTMQAANYGMSSPHGYRKALRLMKLAETFGLPVVTLVDTCGALPSFNAERDGQSEAIATNLTTMAGLKVPIVTIIAGEGGSGGALGIGMGNVVGMLSSAYYGVISPEGAASILEGTKTTSTKPTSFLDCDALATIQRIYAPQLLDLGVIDKVIEEIAGGVH